MEGTLPVTNVLVHIDLVEKVVKLELVSLVDLEDVRRFLIVFVVVNPKYSFTNAVNHARPSDNLRENVIRDAVPSSVGWACLLLRQESVDEVIGQLEDILADFALRTQVVLQMNKVKDVQNPVSVDV